MLQPGFYNMDCMDGMHGCPCPNRTERMVKNETDRCRQAEKESAQMVAK